MIYTLEMPGIEPGAFHMQSERATTALHPLPWINWKKTNDKIKKISIWCENCQFFCQFCSCIERLSVKTSSLARVRFIGSFLFDGGNTAHSHWTIWIGLWNSKGSWKPKLGRFYTLYGRDPYLSTDWRRWHKNFNFLAIYDTFFTAFSIVQCQKLVAFWDLQNQFLVDSWEFFKQNQICITSKN